MWRRFWGRHGSCSVVCIPADVSRRLHSARRPSHDRQRSHRRNIARSSTRDAAGMVVPETDLRARRISPTRFDRQIAASAESIIGPEATDIADSPSAPSKAGGGDCENAFPRLGAHMDPRWVRFRGQRHEAQLLAHSAVTQATGSTEDEGAATDSRARTPGTPSMRSMRADEVSVPGGVYAHVGGTSASASARLASTEVPHRAQVELEDGDQVSAPPASLSVLQRVLRGDKEEVLPAALREGHSPGDGAAADTLAALPGAPMAYADRAQHRTQKAAARQARRERAAERISTLFAAQQHPCPMQEGGCLASTASRTGCGWVQLPSVCCLEQLQHGHCRLHEVHCCPWHHGDAAHHHREAVLAESLFALDPSDPAMMSVRQGRIPQQAPLAAALLQLFVDLLAVRVERVCAAHSDAGSAASTLSLDEICSVPLSDHEGRDDLVLHASLSLRNDLPPILSVPHELAVSALEACLMARESSSLPSAQDGCGEDALHEGMSFEEMWLAETRASMPAGDPQADVSGPVTSPPEAAAAFLQDTACLWSAFFVCREDGVKQARRLQLSPWLTDWAVHTAQEQYRRESAPSHACPADAAPHDLLQGAATRLVEVRVQHCSDVLNEEEEALSATTELAAEACPQRRWAPLLLLKDCLLLRACPSTASTSLLMDVLLAGGVASSSRAAHRSVKHALAQGWHSLHHVLLTVAAGLARYANPPTLLTPSNATVPTAAKAKSLPTRRSGSLALLSLAQPSLIDLAAHVSTRLADCFEDPLRRERGWVPWSDALMFDASRNALYGPGEYVRHHSRVLASACLNSLLNGFLLCTTQATVYHHGLESASPLADVLGLTAGHPALVPMIVPARQSPSRGWPLWVRARRQRRHRQRMASALQDHVQVSLGFLTALQQHSEATLAEQAALRLAYAQRLLAHRQQQEDHAQAADHRTRKYHRTQASHVTDAVREAEQLEPVFDRLLPYGTATVSPEVVAPLLRLLLETKNSAFKALRLSVSAVRVCRLLRHAASLPAAVWTETSKRVHRRVWSKRLGRKVLVVTREPVVKLELPEARDAQRRAASTAVAAATKKAGQAVRRQEAEAAPVGLLFRLDEAVVVEMCRAGLRMGEAGLALADGVRNDCAAGGLADYGVKRGLPSLTVDGLQQALRVPMGSLTSPQTNEQLAAVPGESHSTFLARTAEPVYARDGVEQCLALAGLSRSSQAVAAADRRSVDVADVVGRRVPPTPLLMEMVVSHTPAQDSARHVAYDAQWCRDSARFTRAATVFARHIRMAHQHPLWAMQAYEVVWTRFVDQCTHEDGRPVGLGGSSASLGVDTPAWRVVRREADARREDVQTRLDEARRWQAQSLTSQAGDNTTAPAAMDHVKALLSGAPQPPAARGGTASETDNALRTHKPRRHGAKASLSSCTPGARYELRLYEDWCHTPHQHHPALLSALVAATAASFTPSWLNNPKHGASRCAQSALVHGVLISLLSASPEASQSSLAHICQCLVLSPVLATVQGSRVDSSGQQRSEEEAAGLLLWSGRSHVVRALPLFLALQCALWRDTAGTDSSTSSSSPPTSAAAAAATTTHTDIIAALEAEPSIAAHLPTARGCAAWSLFQPLSLHADLAQRWLHATLFTPSPAFVAWLIAQSDDREENVRCALRTWLTTVSQCGTSGLSPVLLASMLAEVGPPRASSGPPQSPPAQPSPSLPHHRVLH